MNFVTADQMRELERIATENYGIPSIILMENAGRGSSDLLCALLRKENLTTKRIHIICGKGNNGGDGFVLARHLWNREFEVSCLLMGDPEKLTAQSFKNYQILLKLGVPVRNLLRGQVVTQDLSPKNIKDWTNDADILVDALFGIGLSRDLEDENLQIVKALNQSGKKVFSLDIPSGMDADTGKSLPECVQADWTATFGYPKKGFSFEHAASFLGELFVVDISLPRALQDKKPNP